MTITRDSRFKSKRLAFWRCGYTLMEVLAASAVIGIAMAAMASLGGSLMMQEEITWRVAIARNYQENMARLWQLGLRTEDVLNLMPSRADNPTLAQSLYASSIIQVGTTNPASLGSMQVATVTVSVRTTLDEGDAIDQGAAVSLNAYRPTLIQSLRPAAPGR